MKTASKTITGALAAALLTTAVATPAEARPRRYDDRRGGGISLGDVVLGTIAVAGVATVVGALSDGRRSDRGYRNGRYDDRGYDEGRYGRNGYADDQRASIEACSYEAEREAGRRFGSAARVDIDDIDRRRDGYSVRGTVLVQDRYADSGYGRNRYYSRDRNARVAFACTASYGQVDDLRLGSSFARGY